MRILRRSAYTAVPWKNGGGVTHEALRVPPTGDAGPMGVFRWRVSVAEVSSSGPFSDFSGYHRTLVLLRGAGMRLTFEGGEERRLCNAGDRVEFDGGRPTRGDLVEGPCNDLNLMVSASLPRPHSAVEALARPRDLGHGTATTLFFPISGTVLTACGGEAGFLGEWDLGVLEPGEQCRIRPGASAPCLVFFATLEDNSG